MMRRFLTIGFVAGALAGYALNAAAQSTPFKYDPAQEVTITGVVDGVVAMPDQEGNVGVHIIVKTAKGLVAVRLGPAMFIGTSNFSFLVDDQVEIVGVPQSKDLKTIVARSIAKAGRTLALRDEAGIPAWAPVEDGTDGCGVTHTVAVAGTN